VLHEDPADLVAVPAEAFHQAVDAVAGQPEDGVHAPLDQPLGQALADDLLHVRALFPLCPAPRPALLLATPGHHRVCGTVRSGSPGRDMIGAALG
jgi:hypothetical protein